MAAHGVGTDGASAVDAAREHPERAAVLGVGEEVVGEVHAGVVGEPPSLGSAALLPRLHLEDDLVHLVEVIGVDEPVGEQHGDDARWGEVGFHLVPGEPDVVGGILGLAHSALGGIGRAARRQDANTTAGRDQSASSRFSSYSTIGRSAAPAGARGATGTSPLARSARDDD